MNDDKTTSPAKKRFKQLTVMESFSKSGLIGCATNTVTKDHCAVVIEPDGDLPNEATSSASFHLDHCEPSPMLESSSMSVGSDTIQEEAMVLLEVKETISSTITSLTVVEEKVWRGKSLSDMKNLLTSPLTHLELVEVEPGRNHTVLFQIPIPGGDSAPLPHPAVYDDKWDSEHVRLPCSPSNLYPVSSNGNSSLAQRWALITSAFKDTIHSSVELEKRILTYNSRYNNIWNFGGFHSFIGQVMSQEEKDRLFHRTLPGIIDLAMRIQEKVTRSPVLLMRQKAQSLSMSQVQIASLLANAFLNTFPRRNTQKKQSEFSTYPDINFIRLFENKSKGRHVYEKIRCILHYFDRVIEKEPTGTVTFTRQVVGETEFPNWDIAQETLGGFYISSEGTIETEGTGLLQMDFANKFIGGGVLNWGCVQEEIRFVICPELIVSCLFTEVMENNEALVITGCEQYSRYSGYSETFRFEGDYIDTTPRDDYGRRLCQLVAVDATSFRRTQTQFQKGFLLRELNKAYAGFRSGRKGVPLVAVATGNWGCGAFHGDPRLKSLLQLMAAAVAGRDVAYFTFGDEQLRDDVFAMYTMILEKKITVGTLYTILCQYGDQFGESRSSPSLDLYGYLYAVLDALDDPDDGEVIESSNL